MNPRSHAGRILLNIMETLPRDDLIQSSEAELLSIGMGIYYMQERRRIRMFARVDVYHRFISCLVYVPKDVYNADIRNGMQTELFSAFMQRIFLLQPIFQNHPSWLACILW